MNRKLDFEILESEDYLNNLFLNEKDTRRKERLQVIYLIKTGETTKIVKLSKIIAKDRTTIGNWLKKYEKLGLDGLLERNTSFGRPSSLNEEEVAKLKGKLSEPDGFKSYNHIKTWLLEELEINMKYNAVFKLCHDKLGASPKVSRPKNPKQAPEALETFKKNI